MKYKAKFWNCGMATIVFMLGLVAPPLAQAGKATQRPIMEFVDAQGSFCINDDVSGGVYADPCPAGTGLLFVPPVKNFIGWFDPAQIRNASIDYAGLADDYLGNTLGTTFHGNVTERPLADGRAQVIVNLRTRNALTWVIDGSDFANDPLLFGHRTPDVDVADAALCDSHLQVKFINTAPGDPLPELLQILFFPEEGQEVLSVAMRCNAEGHLREGFDDVEDGTPGRAIIVETGLFMTGFHGAVGDGFPVERVDLKVMGKKEKD